MAAKYQQFYQMMLKQNKEDFDEFKKLHDKYVEDPKKYQDQFNRVGSDIMDIIRDWESRLCRASDNAGNSKFTTALSEKFQSEVKKDFPKINSVGIF